MANCTATTPVQGPPSHIQQSPNGWSCTVYQSYPNANLLLETCCNTTTNNIVPNSLKNWTDTPSGTVTTTNYTAKNGCAYEYCDTTGSGSNNMFVKCVDTRFPDAAGASCFFDGKEKSSGNIEAPGRGLVLLALCLLSILL